MASTDISTSSSQASTVAEDHKRTVDEAFLNKLKGVIERLRLENATLKKALDVERSEVRALKAQHEAAVRNIKTEHRKREELLEKQLRKIKPEKDDLSTDSNKLVELKRLTTEIQSLKTANKGLQEKLKVAQAAECARAAELRAQVAKHNALEQAARRDARAQCHKLLEEIKSKERVIMQLRREAAKTATLQHDQMQKMECGVSELSRKLRIEQSKEKSNREDLKTDIQHRKETFYREPPSDEDSAVSSAPASLSPQPLNDMWSCSQCRSATERADASARECARLSDALRDARDQLELMEFRLLELEDANPDKIIIAIYITLYFLVNKNEESQASTVIQILLLVAIIPTAVLGVLLILSAVYDILILITLYFLVKHYGKDEFSKGLEIYLLVSIVPTVLHGVLLIMCGLGRKYMLTATLIVSILMGLNNAVLGLFGFIYFIQMIKYTIHVVIAISFIVCFTCLGMCSTWAEVTTIRRYQSLLNNEEDSEFV